MCGKSAASEATRLSAADRAVDDADAPSPARSPTSEAPFGTPWKVSHLNSIPAIARLNSGSDRTGEPARCKFAAKLGAGRRLGDMTDTHMLWRLHRAEAPAPTVEAPASLGCDDLAGAIALLRRGRRARRPTRAPARLVVRRRDRRSAPTRSWRDGRRRNRRLRCVWLSTQPARPRASDGGESAEVWRGASRSP